MDGYELNLFQIAAEYNKPDPAFKVGDICYYVLVDQIFKMKVTETWEVTDFDKCFQKYGYQIENEAHRTCFNDVNINETAFKSYKDAEHKALKNLSKVVKYSFSKDDILEIKGVQHNVFIANEHDVKHPLFAYVLLLKDNTVVYKMFRCYSFARRFAGENEATKYYRKKVKELENDFTNTLAYYYKYGEELEKENIQPSDIVFQKDDKSIVKVFDLYNCENNKYSEIEYFNNNYFNRKEYFRE